MLGGLGGWPMWQRVGRCVRRGDRLRVQRMVGSGWIRVIRDIRCVRPDIQKKGGEM